MKSGKAGTIVVRATSVGRSTRKRPRSATRSPANIECRSSTSASRLRARNTRFLRFVEKKNSEACSIAGKILVALLGTPIERATCLLDRLHVLERPSVECLERDLQRAAERRD